MTDRVLASGLSSHIGSQVKIEGWLHKKREVSSKLAFLVLRDRTGLVQVVIENAEEIEKLKGSQVGSIIMVIGEVHAEPRAAIGVEIKNPTITVEVEVSEVSPVEIDKPISHDSENFDTLFNYRQITVRSVPERAIFKIKSNTVQAFRQFFWENDFTEIHTPKILAGATEGGTEVFHLDYFGKPACLAQSPQFYKQMMVGAFERVFEIGSAFRAELSFTTRHVTEIMMVDVEIGFIDNHQDVLDMTTKMLNYVVDKTWEKSAKEFEMWNATKPVLAEKYPQITVKDLHQMYFEATGEDFREEKDISPIQERWICEYSKENWASEAVFVTEFPSSSMTFYHMKNEERPEVAYRADLLFRGVEIATVPMREHRYEKLIEQIKAKGLNPEDEGFKYYVSAFKHGLPKHGGFGMGLERIVQKMIGLNSVKEAILFPRDVKRLSP